MHARMTHLFAAAALLLGGVLHAAPAFAPLAQWKSAVIAGDKEALRSLYTAQPAPMIQAGQRTLTLDEELAFWSGLKAAGVHDLDPKLLEVSTRDGATTLVLRVLAVRSDGTQMVAGGLQKWVRQGDKWRIALAQRSEFGREAKRQLPQPETPNTELYPEPSEARAELAAASKLAKRDGKRVLVVFGGNWCYDCHVLDTAFRSPAFAPLVQANYEVVHVNIGDDGRANNDLATEMGVGLDKGVPSLAVLEPNGAVVFAQKDGAFESTVRIGTRDVQDFLEKWKPVRK